MVVKHIAGLVVAVGVLAGTAPVADNATSGPGSSSSADSLRKLYLELAQLDSSADERRSSLSTIRRDMESMKKSLDEISDGIEPTAPPADFINELRDRSPTPPPKAQPLPAGAKPAATGSKSMITKLRKQMAPPPAPRKPAVKRPQPPAAPAAAKRTKPPAAPAPPAAQAATKPRAQPPAKVARAPSPPKKPAAKPSGPSTRVQLASYRSRRNAERGWAGMKKSFPDLLGDLQAEFVQVDIPNKGRFQRLIVRAPAARKLCRQLKARGAYCIKLR